MKDFIATARLNAVLIVIARQLIQFAGFIIWVAFAISIYQWGISLGQDVRIYAFDNLCPGDLRHTIGARWDYATRTLDHVDWCESRWWHSFRLGTRLLFSTIVALLIWLSAKVLLRQTDSSYKRAGYFVIFMVEVHMLWKGLFQPMEEWASQACFLGRYDELLTEDMCIQQLGPFGDQRIFYAFATGVVLAHLFRGERRKIAMKSLAQTETRSTPPGN